MSFSMASKVTWGKFASDLRMSGGPQNNSRMGQEAGSASPASTDCIESQKLHE